MESVAWIRAFNYEAKSLNFLVKCYKMKLFVC
ncbi:hypothetical protein NC651_010890 [Populus alba x Populus x berolinensis]|nr:hypothetical protein NC651_010890 [Populus alba x Populus x berolinensis]